MPLYKPSALMIPQLFFKRKRFTLLIKSGSSRNNKSLLGIKHGCEVMFADPDMKWIF